ncbi:MAG: hypothetical protein QM723_26275 [Myxococcaceae bacterium]
MADLRPQNTIRREVTVEQPGGKLRYLECRNNCLTGAASWTSFELASAGFAPELVDDDNDLPRVFYNPTSPGTGGVLMAQCTTRSNGGCTNSANWNSAVNEYTGDGFGTAGGGYYQTWFSVGLSGPILNVVQDTPNYDQYHLDDCNGANISGSYPAAFISSNFGRLREVFQPPGSAGLSVYYEPP